MDSNDIYGTIPDVDPINVGRGSQRIDEGINVVKTLTEDEVVSGSSKTEGVPRYQPDDNGRV